MLVFIVLFAAFTTCLVQFCITLGAIVAKKAKMLAAIGIYYCINMLMSFVLQFVAGFSIVGVTSGLPVLLNGAPEWQTHLVITIALALACVMMAVPVALMYFMTLNKLERKLNLA